MISEGTYTARAKEAKLGHTSGGAEQVGVLFEITTEGPFKGHGITWYGYFTEKTIERTIEALRMLGWTGTDIAKLNVEGGEANIVVEHDTYNDKTSAKVQWVNRPGSGGIAMKDEMKPAAALSFAEKMKAKVAAFDAKRAASQPAPVPAEPKSKVPF